MAFKLIYIYIYIYNVYTGAFPGKKVLSPNITKIIQDQPSSNV